MGNLWSSATFSDQELESKFQCVVMLVENFTFSDKSHTIQQLDLISRLYSYIPEYLQRDLGTHQYLTNDKKLNIGEIVRSYKPQIGFTLDKGHAEMYKRLCSTFSVAKPS